jgi:hypothetical protein
MSTLSARDVEMVRLAAAVLDGSHPYDAQTVEAVSADLARELRAIAQAHCAHVRLAGGWCRHCDGQQDFGTGGGSASGALMSCASDGPMVITAAGPGLPTRGDSQ